MKKRIRSITSLLILISSTGFSQQDTTCPPYKWEVGIKMNSMKNNIWDPFEVDGINIKNLGWYNGTTEVPHSRDIAYSFGVVIKRKMKYLSLNLRLDYGYRKSTGIFGPTPSQVDPTIYIDKGEDSRKSSEIITSPQIEFSFHMNKLGIFYGLEIPWHIYTNAEYYQNYFTVNKNNNDVYAGVLQSGELAYGHSFGLGLFWGFSFRVFKNISLGGIAFSSADYYVNEGTSYLNSQSINPNTMGHYEDEMDIRAIVYQPVNISITLLYKINNKTQWVK